MESALLKSAVGSADQPQSEMGTDQSKAQIGKTLSGFKKKSS